VGRVAVPELVFRHIDDVPSQEVKAQLHGDTHVGVHLKMFEWGAGCTFIFCHYDPGMTLEVHGHNSTHIIYVLKGSVTISEVNCTPGMMVLLEHGATFGPIIAGPDGTDLLEFYTGDPRAVSVDPEGYEALLKAKGIELLPDPPFVQPSRSAAT
jgi:hypothetical protein